MVRHEAIRPADHALLAASLSRTMRPVPVRRAEAQAGAASAESPRSLWPAQEAADARPRRSVARRRRPGGRAQRPRGLWGRRRRQMLPARAGRAPAGPNAIAPSGIAIHSFDGPAAAYVGVAEGRIPPGRFGIHRHLSRE